MKHHAAQDLAQNELRNALLHPLPAAPAAPKPGQVYFNTTGRLGFLWTGLAWRPLDAAGLADGSVPLAALATNPLARANHTGTQLAATIADLAATVQAYRPDQFAPPAAAVAWGGQRLTALADPAGPHDAATRAYVDTAVQAAAPVVAQSLGTPGYRRWSDGTIEQWGYVNSSPFADPFVTFPVAFTQAVFCLVATLTAASPNPAVLESVSVSLPSLTGFTGRARYVLAGNADRAGEPWYWYARGI